jgi:hypothetical protein
MTRNGLQAHAVIGKYHLTVMNSGAFGLILVHGSLREITSTNNRVTTGNNRKYFCRLYTGTEEDTMFEIKITESQETKAFAKLEDACKFLDSWKKKEANSVTVTHFG